MKNFYLLYGDDKEVLNREINNIKTKLNITNNDITHYDINDIKEIINEAETISMFSNTKLLIIDITSYLSDKKEVSNISLLEDYFEHYNTSSYLVFISNGNIDSRKKIVKLISAKGVVKKLEITNDYLFDFINDYLKQNDYKISTSNINYLISRCGNNINNITNELDKLMLYKIDNKEITSDDINLLTSENIEDSIFDLVSSIINKDTQKAIKQYNNFIINGIEPIQIIIMLSNQIRLLYQVKRLYNQGKSNDEIAKILEFKNAYRVKYLLSDSYYYTEKDLLKYLSSLANLDKNIKLGLEDAKVGLELLITKKDM